MTKNDWETDGTRDGKPIYCPSNDFDCPYYGKGLCHIAEPEEECDEFYFEEDDDEEDYDDYDDVDETGFDPYMGCYSDDCQAQA